MNLNKMRNAVARNTPDQIEKSFDTGCNTTFEYNQWGSHFVHMMRIKHGHNYKGVTTTIYDELGPVSRIVLSVDLYVEV